MTAQTWLVVATLLLLSVGCIANACALLLVAKWQRQHIALFHQARPTRAGITADAHTEERS